VAHHDIDDYEMSEDRDVDIRLPFAAVTPRPEPPSGPSVTAVSHNGTPMVLAAQFLYIERKPAKVYQYHAQPSPGDLKRIEAGKLRVLGFQNGFVEFMPDGTTVHIEVYGCQNQSLPRSRRISTNAVAPPPGAKSRKPRASTRKSSATPSPDSEIRE
jgi:hypothetical protein